MMMRTPRSLSLLLAALWVVVVVVLSPRTHAAQSPGADMAVIAHPDVPVGELTRAELRRILLGDREFWSPGLRITLFIRAPIALERDAAIKDVCQMTEAQFRQHWIAKVFRAETPSGPKIVYSLEMAVDQVSRTPGAISLIPAGQISSRVKVLRIEGRSPGQAGYRLR